jgi:S1-C subfamily serine protease
MIQNQRSKWWRSDITGGYVYPSPSVGKPLNAQSAGAIPFVAVRHLATKVTPHQGPYELAMLAGSRIMCVVLLLICFSSAASVVYAQDCSLAIRNIRNATVFLKADSENPKTGAITRQTGTGFIIKETGYVLTAYHVVKANEGWALTISGAIGSAEAPPLGLILRDSDPQQDVALLKFKQTNLNLTPVFIGNSDVVPQGLKLCSAGFPANDKYQYEFESSEGPLSGTGGPDGRWTTQMPSNPGESGAPVFTIDGIVVALKYGGDSSLKDLNVLTPINFASRLLGLANVTVVLPRQTGPRTLIQNDLITAIYEDAGANIKLTLISPIRTYPTIYVDVNGNTVVDSNVDVAYGKMENGAPCTQYMLSLAAFSACGQFRSNATLAHSEANGSSQDVWLIPKTEVSSHTGNYAGIVIAVMDLRANPPRATVFPSQPFASPFVLSWP